MAATGVTATMGAADGVGWAAMEGAAVLAVMGTVEAFTRLLEI